MRALAAIVWKDIAIELRNKESVTSMIMFGLLVVVLSSFVLPPESGRAGVLWIAFSFASVMGLNRALAMESLTGMPKIMARRQRVIQDFGDGNIGAERPDFAAGINLVEAGELFDIHQRFRLGGQRVLDLESERLKDLVRALQAKRRQAARS